MIHLWRSIEFGKYNHAFPHLFPLHTFKSERGRLAGGAHGYWYAFSLDRSNVGGRELTKAVWTYEDSVAGMDGSCST